MSSPSATLYYTPTSCGAASFMAQAIAGLNLKTVEVDIGTHKVVADGSDYKKINPKGNVPALVLADGTLFNEGAAVLQWIADHAPASKLAAPAGTPERYHLINEINFTATDLHAASYGPLFNPSLSGDAKKAQLDKLHSKLKYLNDVVLKGGKKFVVGDRLSVADLYLVTVLGWSGYLGVDLSPYSNINSYIANVNSQGEVVSARQKLAEASKKA